MFISRKDQSSQYYRIWKTWKIYLQIFYRVAQGCIKNARQKPSQNPTRWKEITLYKQNNICFGHCVVSSPFLQGKGFVSNPTRPYCPLFNTLFTKQITVYIYNHKMQRICWRFIFDDWTPFLSIPSAKRGNWNPLLLAGKLSIHDGFSSKPCLITRG